MTFDPILLDRLHRGEDAAYEQVVRRHVGRMLFVARVLMGDEECARSVVQAAFLAAFDHLPSPGATTPIPMWLWRHVVHESVGRLWSPAPAGTDGQSSHVAALLAGSSPALDPGQSLPS